jgi:hypothetical protein
MYLLLNRSSDFYYDYIIKVFSILLLSQDPNSNLVNQSLAFVHLYLCYLTPFKDGRYLFDKQSKIIMDKRPLLPVLSNCLFLEENLKVLYEKTIFTKLVLISLFENPNEDNSAQIKLRSSLDLSYSGEITYRGYSLKLPELTVYWQIDDVICLLNNLVSVYSINCNDKLIYIIPYISGYYISDTTYVQMPRFLEIMNKLVNNNRNNIQIAKSIFLEAIKDRPNNDNFKNFLMIFNCEDNKESAKDTIESINFIKDFKFKEPFLFDGNDDSKCRNASLNELKKYLDSVFKEEENNIASLLKYMKNVQNEAK